MGYTIVELSRQVLIDEPVLGRVIYAFDVGLFFSSYEGGDMMALTSSEEIV
jgi:hypothetical protein